MTSLTDALAWWDSPNPVGDSSKAVAEFVAAARRVAQAPQWLQQLLENPPTSDTYAKESQKVWIDVLNRTAPTSADMRALRAYLGETQVWLADQMGVDKATVSRWEHQEGPLKGSAKGAYHFLQLEMVRKLLVDPADKP